jgi:hypothetical protein
MGTPINTPLTSEIWHLTIDDLLEPVAAAPCLGGPGPFVINLSASTAPISLPMKAVAHHPGTHLYQIQRTEDRRVRYRLRLGPFESEGQAEALLPLVREIYPSAFTAGAEPEDVRAIESIKTKIEAQQLAAVKAAMSKAAPAPLPNAARFNAPRVAPPEPPRDPPSMGAGVDGGVLPASPPAAWLALQTQSTASEVRSVEPDFPPPKPDAVKAVVRERAASAPAFAPARWSASARAFVPNTGFAPPTRTPAAASPTPRAAATAVPVAPAAPELAAPAAAPTVATTPVAAASRVPAAPAALTARAAAAPARLTAVTMPPAPVAAVPADSLIPVLSDSMAVLRPAAPARVSVTTAVPKPAAPAPAAAGPAPVAAAPAPMPVTLAPVAAALGAASAAPVPAAAVAPARATTATAPALSAPPPVASTPVPTPARVVATAAVPLETPTAASGVAIGPRTAAAAMAGAIGKENKFMPPRRSDAPGTPLSSLDTTQTLRPLTPKELEDASVLRWFVIQLSCSEEAFDPDSLPYLDIFTEYRLYSVAGLEQGKLVHVLRLGFFSEESHAKAVAGYLGSFYASPVIKRVSAAERTRFAQHRVEARKDIGATGRHAVIEITDQRVIRPKRPGNPPAPPLSPTPPSARVR